MNRLNGFLRESTKKTADITVEPATETAIQAKRQTWKPVTLRRPSLSAVTFITLGLLALVQVLVVYDQRHNGIIFAPKISEMGTGYIFLYRYLPTILSVTYGLIWHWIDIDTRRVEPYRQLSKPGGATGTNSLLLHYPTDLLAFVPLKALKRKHWPVVLSSSALVLVGMGLTPLQAAMFATETVVKSFAEPMLLSNHRLSIVDQAAQLTANYTFSVANIVWLDERLPPFMTHEAAFTPFKPAKLLVEHDDELMTATTTSFGVDVTCESAVNDTTAEVWSSSQGCHVKQPFGPLGTDIVGIDVIGEQIKEHTPFFAGYSGGGGNVNYYLSPYCPKNASNVFMVALGKNRKSLDDPPANVTRLFCETSYYQQDVLATVRRADGSLSYVASLGAKSPLPSTLFNTTIFEDQISNARQQNGVRGALPSTQWPDQRPQLSGLPLTISYTLTEMYNIFGLAIGAYPREFEDYMDAKTLAASFQAAHRLLFARAMVDVLAADYEDSETINGMRVYTSEAVRIIPRFAYAVEAVLGVVALMAFTLTAVTWFDVIHLGDDPDSLSALMLLVKGQSGILDLFSQHDQSSWALLKSTTSRYNFALEQPFNTSEGTLKVEKCSHGAVKLEQRHAEDKPDFKYPLEFSMIVGAVFVLALMSVLAGVTYLYQSSRDDGLALPSQYRVVRQILENYIPTIIATLIEPVWVVLNRLMCMLQPFEELRSGNAPAQRSVDLKYSSLPPQFSILRALKAKHFILSAVCAMALLVNVLAVAFSGLLDEETLVVAHDANATSTFEPHLKADIVSILESADPSAFYYAMANFTSGTPMPQWTDNSAFYLPAFHEAQLNQSDQLQLRDTPALAASLQCAPVGRAHGSSWTFSGGTSEDTAVGRANFTVAMTKAHDQPLRCSTENMTVSSSYFPWPCSSQQTMAIEFMAPLMAERGVVASESDPCQGLLLAAWARKPASAMCGDYPYTISDGEAMVMVCKQKVTVQSVNLTMTGDYRVLEAASDMAPEDFSGSEELIKETTHALWRTKLAENAFLFNGGMWHNDSFPSDWHSYVMNMMDPDNELLDPTLPPPDFDQTADLFTRAYQKMFAIWLSLDHERLLAQAVENDSMISATVRRPEIRIVVSRPMAILSSTILGMYIIVAIAVYAHRPGRFLPRMPLTMASDIALFAASKAVRDMEEADTSKHDIGSVRRRFGYGRFVGVDGKPHVGVERAPFVIPLS